MTGFCIFPCRICGKTPAVNKNLNRTDEYRYTIGHCEMTEHGTTETLCIVNWNKMQYEVSDHEE